MKKKNYCEQKVNAELIKITQEYYKNTTSKRARERKRVRETTGTER